MSALVSQATVYIIDDDAVLVKSYRAALASIVQTQAYETCSQFLDEVADDPSEGCLVVDLQLGNESGLDLIESIRRRGWTVPTIVVSGTVTVPSAMTAVEYGVFCVLQKPVSASALKQAVMDALNAKRAKLTRGQLKQALQELTSIEQQVLDLMLKGFMNKVISTRLDISLRSVVRHRKHVLSKLGAAEPAELIREWTLAGLDTAELTLDSVRLEALSPGYRVRLHTLADRLRQVHSIGQLEAIATELERLADSGR